MENILKNVKLRSISMRNIKNILSSTIIFKENVSGIYGQNGSGKTAVIDAISILKNVILSNDVSSLNKFINVDGKEMELNYSFVVGIDSLEYKINYSFSVAREVRKDENDGNKDKEIAIIKKEKLDYNCDQNGDEKSINVNHESILFQILNEKNNSKKHIVEIFESKNKIIEAFMKRQSNNSSFLFSNEIMDCMLKDSTVYKVLMILKCFSIYNLFIITTQETGKTSLGKIVLNISNKHVAEENTNTITGKVLLDLNYNFPVDEVTYNELLYAKDKINTVMENLVPGFKLEMKFVLAPSEEENKKIYNVSLYSVRNEKLIPLSMESEGIKKLVSLSSALIALRNDESVIVVVDELDSGIFEYLLGSLVGVLSQESKGQLIFTSHNLVLLEKLKKDCIIFSTSNPENRFIEFRYVKENNNLRNCYLRALLLGGQKEKLYNETDDDEISFALYKAR